MSASEPEPEEPSESRLSVHPAPPTEQERLLDRASIHDAIFYGLIALCVGLFASDILYHKHAHFEFEQSLGFHGLFGFVAYLTIVNSAKLLRRFVMRSEDYYDR